MEKIISFVVNNWKLCAYCVLVIVHFVLLFVRKKPVKVIDSIYQEIFKFLLVAIDSVECPGLGSQKKATVLSMLEDWLQEKHPEIDFQVYLDFASKMIEDILSTPQKKGV